MTTSFSNRRRTAWLLAPALAGALLLAGCSSGGSTHFNSAVQRWFSSLQGPHAKARAAELFNTVNADQRREAIYYFSRQPYGHRKPFMAAYRLLTTDPDPLVRGQALLALAGSHQPAVAPYLINGLSDKSTLVRVDAAVGLQQVQAPTAIPVLVQRLQNDVSPEVRGNCAIALQRYHRKRVIRALIVALDDRNMAVVEFAWKSLRQITGQKFPRYSRPWRRWLHKNSGAPKPA